MLVGLVIRYTSEDSEVTTLPVAPIQHKPYNDSLPPDILILKFRRKTEAAQDLNKTYSYKFKGEVHDEENVIAQKVKIVKYLGLSCNHQLHTKKLPLVSSI